MWKDVVVSVQEIYLEPGPATITESLGRLMSATLLPRISSAHSVPNQYFYPTSSVIY